MPDYLNPDNNPFENAIINLERLITDYETQLDLREIYNYDEQLIPEGISVAITFNTAQPQTTNINSQGGCRPVMNVNLYLYLYLESLQIGRETLDHVKRMGLLTTILYANNRLFGLCHSERMVINNVAMVARRLQSDVFLAGQYDITVPIRFCFEGRDG